MKPSHILNLLDEAARQHIPDERNLLPGILARIQPQEKKQMKLKIVWTVLAVLLGLGLITGAGYALYRVFFHDPGIDAVQEAGLVSPVEQSAAPTLQPQITTPPALPETPVQILGQTQTLQGVTWTLEWLQINTSGLQFGFSMSGSPAEPQLPAVQVSSATDAPRGQVLWLQQDGGQWAGIYRLNQYLPAGSTDLTLLLGLTGQTGPAFHLNGLDVQPGQMPTSQYIYSAQIDARERTLEAVVLGPQTARARVCATGEPAPDWAALTIQADLGGLGEPPRISAGLHQVLPVPQAPACADLLFDLPASQQPETLHLTLTPTVGTAWEFFAEAPAWPESAPHTVIQPQPTATPIAAQTVGQLTATLDWVYADTQRVAMQMRFEGWQPTYRLWDAVVTTADGQELYLNTAQPANEDASTYLLLFYASDKLSGDSAQLTLNLPVQDANDWQTTLAAFQFQMTVPVYPGIQLTDVPAVTANGLTLRLERAEITPSYTSTILCYDKPTHGPGSDWGVSAGTQLQTNQTQIGLLDYVLLQDADAQLFLDPQRNFTSSQPADRCIELGFPIGSVQQPGSVLTLVIPGLELSMPESIPADSWAAAQKKLAAQGIQIEQYTFSANGGGGGGWNILQRPPGMSDEQVYQLTKEALGCTYPGPWVFELTLP